MPAIKPHSTDTVDQPWDGPANEQRLKTDSDEAYYRSAFAWVDPEGDPETKAAYRFIHHEVSGDGEVEAANVRAAIAGIAVLNGARGGTTIPSADRQGVYNHLAEHLMDADMEPPAMGKMSFAGMEVLAAALGSVNRKKRQAEIVFYSGAPVQRIDFWTGEIYDLRYLVEPGSVRLDRLNAGGAILNNHNTCTISDQVGVVEKAWIESGAAKALIKFSRRDDVEPIWQDVQDGIIRNVSMGAQTHQLQDITPDEEKQKKNGRRSLLVVDWEPMEISLVPVPADPGAGFLSAQCIMAPSVEQQQQLQSATQAGLQQQPWYLSSEAVQIRLRRLRLEQLR